MPVWKWLKDFTTMRLQFSWLLAEEMTKNIYIIIFELKWLNKIVDFFYFTDLGMESISWQ